MTGKGCRDKGSRFEREVAKILRDWSGDDTFQRAFLSRSQGTVIGDIVTPKWFPWAVSCKCQERWNLEQLFLLTEPGAIVTWWKEHETACGDKRQPMLLMSRNRMSTVVMMKADFTFAVPWRNVNVRRAAYRTVICRLDEWLEANPANHWKGVK